MSVLAEVAALPKRPTKELNALWRKYFDNDPPQAGKSYLVRRLAYRIQELAHGVGSRVTNDLLNTMANATVKKITKPPESGTSLTPGTRLIREWNGMEHFVTVMDQGFEYQGRKFRSLSAVAKAITGTHWSGPAFFGMKRSKPQ
jgi:hypothetical protein